MKNKIKIIAFDADDTLWLNEVYYRKTEHDFADLLKEYGERDFVIEELFKTEMQNLKLYGYGAKGFMLSMLETAIRVSAGKVSSEIQRGILELGKSLLLSPLVLLPQVMEVLTKLKTQYKLILATKGDLLDQERKLENSKLNEFFHHVEIMSDKKEDNYQKLLNHLDIKADELLMIGNSLKSDIIPPLNLGCFAAHIPHETTWQHEKVGDDKISNDRFYNLKHLKDILQELI